jgi:hypothetical protein
MQRTFFGIDQKRGYRLKINKFYHITKDGVVRHNPRRIRGFKVKCKSQKIMGEYICLHGLVPQNELPHHLRGKIPKDELWVREDRYNDSHFLRHRMLYVHESHELKLMEEKGMTYKKAHARAEIVDLWW